ncbi:MAG: hypothetical protein RL648_90, partial [Verrucomicrobiota bacterium]
HLSNPIQPLFNSEVRLEKNVDPNSVPGAQRVVCDSALCGFHRKDKQAKDDP